nr:hypothetical protein [Myxosarcina sp. GI1]
MLITIIVVGVIAAIAAPNLLGLLNRNRINTAIGDIEGAIREAQRQAMRSGRSCNITIDTTDNDNAISGGCLLSTRSLKNSINFNSNLNAITFSGKGNTNNSAILVVSMPDGTDSQKCLVMNAGLGLIRTGDYSGDPTGALAEANCQ